MTTPIDSSLLPADVREAGPEARKLYGAALGFERLLTSQLTKQLAEDAVPTDEDGGPAPYADMLPDALAGAVESAGGLGLARSLYDTLEKRS